MTPTQYQFDVELKYELSESNLTVSRIVTATRASQAVEAAQNLVDQDLGIVKEPAWVHIFLKQTLV